MDNLNFKFEPKRINEEKKLPPLCKDYEPKSDFGNCKRAEFCKNASYMNIDGKKGGICFGGTKEDEIESRKCSVLFPA